MADEITATTLTNQILTELIMAEVGEETREASLMLPLCKVTDLGSVPTLTGSYQYHNAVTVSSITDGTALSNAAYTQDNVTIAVSQIGAKVVVTDLGLESTVADHLAAIPGSIAADVAVSADTTIAALLGGFSNTVGTTTEDLTWAQLLQAITTLRINAKGQAQNAVIVLYPQQVFDLQSAGLSYIATGLTTTQATANTPVLTRGDLSNLFGGAPGAAVLGSYVGDVMGVPVFQSANVPTANSAADSAGAVFVRDNALGVVVKWLPRVEMQRTIVDGIPGYAIMVHMAFGAGELRDLHGVSIISDR